MKLVEGSEWGAKLCKALGLPTENVHAIDIRIRPGEVVTANVIYLAEADMEEIIKLSQGYQLVEIEDKDG